LAKGLCYAPKYSELALKEQLTRLIDISTHSCLINLQCRHIKWLVRHNIFLLGSTCSLWLLD